MEKNTQNRFVLGVQPLRGEGVKPPEQLRKGKFTKKYKLLRSRREGV